MNAHRLGERVAIHTRNVAFQVVKTHQPMNVRNSRESGIDRALKTDDVLSVACDLHKRPEQRTRATDFNA
jgi:hypothetical protein